MKLNMNFFQQTATFCEFSENGNYSELQINFGFIFNIMEKIR